MGTSTESASSQTRNSTTAAACPPVDEKEEFLATLCGALVLLREAAEGRDLRFVLRMLRRLSVLRRQQQRCLPQLLQTAETLLWSAKAAGTLLLDSRSNPTRRSYAASLASPLPAGSLEFWLKMKTALETEVARRSSDKRAMEVDGSAASSSSESSTPSRALSSLRVSSFIEAVAEVESLLSLLVILALLDGAKTAPDKEKAEQLQKAWDFSCAAVERIQKHDKRSLDRIAAKIWFFHCRAHELSGQPVDLRETLLKGYRTATVRHDCMTQVTLMNWLLRTYIRMQEFDVALKFVLKTAFPESLKSNAQQARYLYYLGSIQAARLEYGSSFSQLQLALKKAPQQPRVARGFKLAALRKAVVVELLMGDIPERAIFEQKDLQADLARYRDIVLAVRSGDLCAFGEALSRHGPQFRADDTYRLLTRLHHNVIRAGLRIICLSYSRIKLTDVAAKLRLESAEEAEAVASRAILDGVVDASIDHEEGCLQSKADIDLYVSNEPQKAFNKRIGLCLDLYNDAVRAMQYPGSVEVQMKEDDDKKRALQEERARAEEDDLGDDLDLM